MSQQKLWFDIHKNGYKKWFPYHRTALCKTIWNTQPCSGNPFGHSCNAFVECNNQIFCRSHRRFLSGFLLPHLGDIHSMGKSSSMGHRLHQKSPFRCSRRNLFHLYTDVLHSVLNHPVCYMQWSYHLFNEERHLSDFYELNKKWWFKGSLCLVPESHIKHWQYEFSMISSTSHRYEKPSCFWIRREPSVFARIPVLLENSLVYFSSMASHGIVSAFLTQRFSRFIFNPTGWL